MPTPFIGYSSTRWSGESKQYKCNTSGLKEGAVMVYDTSVAGQLVKAPAGAGATGVAGVLINAQPSGGTAVGDSVDLQISGIANVLLKAGQTVNVGDKVVIGGTDGS